MIHIDLEESERKGKFTIYEDDIPVGEMTFLWAGKRKIIIDHTETYEGFNGKGYAKKLVMKGIEYARERQIKILPLCPYAKGVIEKNAQFHDILFIPKSE